MESFLICAPGRIVVVARHVLSVDLHRRTSAARNRGVSTSECAFHGKLSEPRGQPLAAAAARRPRPPRGRVV